MRFWSPFHTYSLDIITKAPNKLIFRAPDCVRLRMTVDHLEVNQKSGTCFTHYNHQTRLWECLHSPGAAGQHRLFVWVSDSERDDQWTTAVRFDVYVREQGASVNYPTASNVFNLLRCQLIAPIDDNLSRDSLPADIIVRVPHVRDVQLQIDEQTLVAAQHLYNDMYKVAIPAGISDRATDLVLMGLCSDDMYYSTLLTYKIE